MFIPFHTINGIQFLLFCLVEVLILKLLFFFLISWPYNLLAKANNIQATPRYPILDSLPLTSSLSSVRIVSWEKKKKDLEQVFNSRFWLCRIRNYPRDSEPIFSS